MEQFRSDSVRFTGAYIELEKDGRRVRLWLCLEETTLGESTYFVARWEIMPNTMRDVRITPPVLQAMLGQDGVQLFVHDPSRTAPAGEEVLFNYHGVTKVGRYV